MTVVDEMRFVGCGFVKLERQVGQCDGWNFASNDARVRVRDFGMTRNLFRLSHMAIVFAFIAEPAALEHSRPLQMQQKQQSTQLVQNKQDE